MSTGELLIGGGLAFMLALLGYLLLNHIHVLEVKLNRIGRYLGGDNWEDKHNGN